MKIENRSHIQDTYRCMVVSSSRGLELDHLASSDGLTSQTAQSAWLSREIERFQMFSFIRLCRNSVVDESLQLLDTVRLSHFV